MSEEVDQLLEGGGKSAKFSDERRQPIIGKTYKGTVVKMEAAQQTDMDTKKPKVWLDSGKPMMQLVVTLQCQPEDPDDDGIRRLYATGGGGYIHNWLEAGALSWPKRTLLGVPTEKGARSMLEAIKKALSDSGCKASESVGGELAVQLSELGKPSNPAYSPPYRYIAAFKKAAPAATSEDVAALLG